MCSAKGYQNWEHCCLARLELEPLEVQARTRLEAPGLPQAWTREVTGRHPHGNLHPLNLKRSSRKLKFNAEISVLLHKEPYDLYIDFTKNEHVCGPSFTPKLTERGASVRNIWQYCRVLTENYLPKSNYCLIYYPIISQIIILLFTFVQFNLR